MNTTKDKLTTVRLLAPEDVRPGDYVTPHDVTLEWPSFMWRGEGAVKPHETVRQVVCAFDAGTPLKVLAVCVPYVLVRDAHRVSTMLDLRQVKLARLDPAFAARAWGALKKNPGHDGASRPCRKCRKKSKAD